MKMATRKNSETTPRTTNVQWSVVFPAFREHFRVFTRADVDTCMWFSLARGVPERNHPKNKMVLSDGRIENREAQQKSRNARECRKSLTDKENNITDER